MVTQNAEIPEKLNPAFLPPVTVLISTRNRGDKVTATIQSILNNDYPEINLIVLDQSDNDLTEKAVLPFLEDSRFRYISSSTRGSGAGRNAAVSFSQTEYLAFTDDDCEVKSNWLHEIIEAFKIDPGIGLVSGNVIATEYDRTLGDIPVFEWNTPTLLKNINDNLSNSLGISACYAIKRSAWQAVRGFDEMLGPGTPFGSTEDRDLAIRLLFAGFYIYHSPKVVVTHFGFRRNDELRSMTFRHWLSRGAIFAKYLKCGHWDITELILGKFWVGQALGGVWYYFKTSGRLGRGTPVVVFWVGFVFGLLWPVDSKTIHFKQDQSYKLKALNKLNALFSIKK